MTEHVYKTEDKQAPKKRRFGITKRCTGCGNVTETPIGMKTRERCIICKHKLVVVRKEPSPAPIKSVKITKLESLKMFDDLLQIKANDSLHGVTAKEVLNAVLPHINQTVSDSVSKKLDDKHLTLCFSRYYTRQVIVSYGFNQLKFYCDLDCAWFDIEVKRAEEDSTQRGNK